MPAELKNIENGSLGIMGAAKKLCVANDCVWLAIHKRPKGKRTAD
jgi:hypothetical protein